METKVSTRDLLHGMYVSNLDRPWLETPFLLQGFRILSDRDIELLQQYCEFVYVDEGRSEGPLRRSDRRKTTDRRRQYSSVLPDKPVVYTDTAEVRRELVEARRIHNEISGVVTEFLDDVRAGNSVHLDAVKESVGHMLESILRNPDAFMWLRRLKDKDSYTYVHSIDAAALAMALGRQIGLPRPDLENLGTGTLLFDIGKMKIPSEVLNKPSRLSAEEFEVVRKHVHHGVAILQESNGVALQVIEVVATHHERYDGTGYPRGIKAGAIPLFGRIAAIVDCYDAMTSNRAYAAAVSPHEATRRLYDWRDTLFQSELVELFIQALGLYPTGTLVELTTGEIGIVISQNRVRRLRPKVMLILDSAKKPHEFYPVVDLIQQETDDEGHPIEICKVHSPGAYGLHPEDYFLK